MAQFDKEGYIEIPPVAGGLSETLRAAGYEFVDAMADLVDNSIDAGATEIYVNIGLDSYLEPFIYIADNGSGMSRVEIAQALTYGSIDSASEERLGKFGIGLKTASTAFCRRIVILTRDELRTCWRGVLDLDDIKNNSIWRCRVTELESAKERAFLDNFVDRGTGTLIWWDEVDHLFDKDSAREESLRKRKINAYAKKFSQHASLTFHRFLDKHDGRARNIDIYMNDEPLRANNPLCESEGATEVLNSTSYNVLDERDEIIGGYTFTLALLPEEHDFSSSESFKRANITLGNQGIYIYRNNRVISLQGWMGLRERHPSGNYLRAALDMDYQLDEVLKIDYKKDSVTAREGFTDRFKNTVALGFASAQRRSETALNKKKEQNFFSTSAPVVAVPKREAKEKAEPRKATRADVWVSPAKPIGDGSLWNAAKDKGKTELRCNTEHPFYRLADEGRVSATEAIEVILWELGKFESDLVDGSTAKKMMGVARDAISSELRHIAETWDEASVKE